MNRINFLAGLFLTCASWMPVLISAQTTTATITNTFDVMNPGTVTAAFILNTALAPNKQLLATYTSVATLALKTYDDTVTGSLTLGATKLSSATVKTCSSTAPSGSVCHAVTATYQYTYKTTDFSTKPETITAQKVQDQINAGNMACTLKKLYPNSILKVTTGGGCKIATPTAMSPTKYPTGRAPVPTTPTKKPTVKSPVRTPTNSPALRTPTKSPTKSSSSVTTVTIKQTFRTTTNGTTTAATLNDPSSTDAKQLLAAFDALMKKRVAAFQGQGPVTYLGAKALSATEDTSYMCNIPGNHCQIVSATFDISYNPGDFYTAPDADITNSLQHNVNTGSLGCTLKKLYPNSLMVITSGNNNCRWQG